MKEKFWQVNKVTLGFKTLFRYLNPNIYRDQDIHKPSVKSARYSESQGRTLKSIKTRIEEAIITIIDDLHSWTAGEFNKKNPFEYLKKVGDSNLRYVFYEKLEETQEIEPNSLDKGTPISLKKTKAHKTNLRLLPNMRKMEIVKVAINKSLSIFGISWVAQRRIKLWGWRNRKSNKYLKAQYSRLWHYRGKTDKLSELLPPGDEILFTDIRKNLRTISQRVEPNTKYWNHALFLMQRSRAFQSVYFNAGLKNWERSFNLWSIMEIADEVLDLVSTGNWNKLRITRCWIESNGLRPLGVPAKAHNIVGSMLTALLEFYTEGSFKINEAYHAYHGTGTSWHRLIAEKTTVFDIPLKDFPYIWETDISGFFNDIRHESIYHLLKALRCPAWLCIRLIQMQQTAPILTTSKKDLPESWTGSAWGNITVKRSMYGGRSQEIVSDTVPGANKTMYYRGNFNPGGVAQGSSLSPLLAILPLEYCLRFYQQECRVHGYFVEILAYADDLLLFSPSPIPLPLFEERLLDVTYCTISQKKTHWVKIDHEWQRPLKFLGLEYFPFLRTGVLKANTKNGSRIVLDRSLTQFFKGSNYLETKKGWLWMEPYELGKPIITTAYESDGKYTEKEPYWPKDDVLPIMIGILSIILAYNLHWIFFLMLISLSFYHYPRIKTSNKVEASTWLITWRAVVKAKLLNKFIAKLYLGTLKDEKIIQNFKLWPISNSLIEFLKNQKEYNWRDHWLKLGKRHKILRILLETSELLPNLNADLGAPLTVFNSSTIGVYFLQKILTELRKGKKFKSSRKLHRISMETLNLPGYWSEIGPPFTSEHATIHEKPLADRLINHQLKTWAGMKQKLKFPNVLKGLDSRVDWYHCLSISRNTCVDSDRTRIIKDYWTGDQCLYTRIYKTYRGFMDSMEANVYTPVYNILGFVPIRPYHKRPKNGTNPQSMTERAILSIPAFFEVDYRRHLLNDKILDITPRLQRRYRNDLVLVAKEAPTLYQTLRWVWFPGRKKAGNTKVSSNRPSL